MRYLQGMNHSQQCLQSEKLKGACCGAMIECQSLFDTVWAARDLKKLLGGPQEYEHHRRMYRKHGILNQGVLDQRLLSNGKHCRTEESWRSCCKHSMEGRRLSMQLQSNHTRETIIYVSLGISYTYTIPNRFLIVRLYHNDCRTSLDGFRHDSHQFLASRCQSCTL